MPPESRGRDGEPAGIIRSRVPLSGWSSQGDEMRNVKKFSVLGLAVAAALFGSALLSPADARSHFSIGVGVGLGGPYYAPPPGYYAPPPGFYAPPPPVAHAPPLPPPHPYPPHGYHPAPPPF